MASRKPQQEEAEALEKLKRQAAKLKGTYRYLRFEDGQWIKFPEMMGSPHYTDPDHMLRRQVCVGLNDEQTAIKWQDMPDAPVAPVGYEAPERAPSDERHLTAATPPFDWQPPRYNQDQHSGGPANFDGNAGGDDNPRDPRLEGEVPNEYNQKLAEFQAEIASANA